MQAATYDCSGGTYPDIIVGMSSMISGRGSVEVWQNNFLRRRPSRGQEVYPTAGGVPAASWVK